MQSCTFARPPVGWGSGCWRSAAFAHDTRCYIHTECYATNFFALGTGDSCWKEHFQNYQLPAWSLCAAGNGVSLMLHMPWCRVSNLCATQVVELCFATVRKQSFTFQDKPLEITQLCQNPLATEAKFTENWRHEQEQRKFVVVKRKSNMENRESHTSVAVLKQKWWRRHLPFPTRRVGG